MKNGLKIKSGKLQLKAVKIRLLTTSDLERVQGGNETVIVSKSCDASCNFELHGAPPRR